MTSILTNGSALSALQTLRSVSSGLEATQRMVSSGLRVGVAADNAAYWSISTTMRSDRMAISTVSDALGFGAAKVDVGYTATTAIVDILDTVKSRLVAAQEAGVDKSKIQGEIEQLKEQAVAIVSGASFNGVNYLKTSEAQSLLEVETLDSHVISAFVRSADGNVSVKQAEINLKTTSMLNVGGGGILQKEVIGDYPDLQPLGIVSYFHEGHEDHTFNGPVAIGATESITFDLVLDRSPQSTGITYAMTIDKALVDGALGTSDGVIHNAADVRKILQKAFDDAGAPASAYRSGDTSLTMYDVTTLEATGHLGSSIYFENLASDLPGGSVLGLDSSSAIDHDNMRTEGATAFTKAFTMPVSLVISFEVQIAGGASQTVQIDRDTVNDALGITNARVETATDFATVVSYAAAGIGLDLEVDGSTINFFADQAVHPGYGNNAVDFFVSDFRTNQEWLLRFDLAEIDITGNEYTVEDYLVGVEYMLQRSISSASNLGALSKRIHMQAELGSKLMATIDKGIGRLVDADMNEASTRLKALQIQEQLAIQALSLANSNAENVMQLFR
ncbi:flagellin [Hoeflea sp.]|uniref:flagellin N-terminal helical domain-containing protein n=1 Tax=Hoeflea sp. TaxID=1940281 RepID=UPI0019A485E2|nr:flagellin [Hoeflea sp.]MBC7284013.1 flagellin [Hoeflea sp.]